MNTTAPGAAAPIAEVPEPESTILTAPLNISFDYTRSLGPVLSQFAFALRDGRIVGNRVADGRVFVPPVEYDPVTAAPVSEFVDVATVGTIVSWSWQPSPTAGQPLDKPFAWALIRLDGADTTLLHAVAVDSPDDVSTGARVHAVWRAARVGLVTDIAHFALGDAPEPAPANTAENSDDEQVVATTPIALSIMHAASDSETWYLEGLKNGKLVGGRVDTGEVYFPPRVASPADGSPTTERVEVADTGIVTTFCIVNVPFLGQQIKPPYVAAYILLDGADIPFLHLILDVAADEVRMGMRVKAVWRPESEWDYTMRNVSHFAPTGELDADYESYRNHL